MIETGYDVIWPATFLSDGKQILSGHNDGLRRWRVTDGREVGNQMGVDGVVAISVSRDGKWIVCGTSEGASVSWDDECARRLRTRTDKPFVGAGDEDSN